MTYKPKPRQKTRAEEKIAQQENISYCLNELLNHFNNGFIDTNNSDLYPGFGTSVELELVNGKKLEKDATESVWVKSYSFNGVFFAVCKDGEEEDADIKPIANVFIPYSQIISISEKILKLD